MEIVFDKVHVIKNKNTAFQKTVLKDFTMELKEGQINGICGGRGKSTVGKLICALEDISSGELKVGKCILSRRKYQKNINDLRFHVGYLFSNPYDFLYKRTVKEELEFGLRYYKYKLDKLETRAKDALRMVGLNDSYLDRNPRDLSYSEAKKVMLATVLSFNPDVIILDDFEKGLNKSDRIFIKRLLIQLRKKYNKTIIIITNDMSFMFDFCEHIYLIDDGKVIMDGDKTLLFNLDLYHYVEMPKIIEFTEYARSKGHKLGKYTDIKDLLKAVYRDAE